MQLGIEFEKSPNQGENKGIALIKDPDGHFVEILPKGEN